MGSTGVERIGRFELRGRLGRGGMGDVYRAFDPQLRREVALKVIRSHLGDQGPARFLREARSAAALSHRGIVTIYELGEANGVPFVAMELIAASTLRERLRSGPLDFADARRITAEIAAALAHAHSRGVVHRDLKPENVLLRDEDGRVALVDFGIAHVLFDASPHAAPPSTEATPDARPTEDAVLTREGTVVGTPGYMAPEQILGAGVDGKVDVFALGAIWYELVTGNVAFGGASSNAVLLATLTSSPPPVQTLAPSLPDADVALIGRMLSREAADRPSATELVQALALAPSPVVALAAAPSAETSLPTAPLQVLDLPTVPTPALPRLRRRGVGPRLLFGFAAVAVLAAVAWGTASILSRLPAADRRVAVMARNIGVADYDHLTPAVSRMASAKLAASDHRFQVVADDAQANVVVTVEYRVTTVAEASRVDVIATLRAASAPSSHATVSASGPSVAEALDALVLTLAEELGEGQLDLGPTDEERAAMADLGTASVQAYRIYQTALDDYMRTVMVDPEASRGPFAEALRLDPEWHHARVALALVQGVVTPSATETIRGGAGCRAAPGKDVSGCELLLAAQARAASNPEEERTLASPVLAAHPHDILAGLTAMVANFFAGHVAEAIACARRLYEGRPELQFGSDLAGLLRANGRSDEVPELVRTWRERAPEAEQALIEAITVAVELDDDTAAGRDARDLLLLFGEAPHRLVILCDVEVMLGRFAEARAIADRLIQTTGINRVRGLARAGLIGILEGRFATAEETLAAALKEAAASGNEFERYPAIGAWRELATDRAGYIARTKELAGEFERLGVQANVARLKFELQLLDRGERCPSADTAIAAVSDVAERTALRRQVLREAADAGCAPCKDVVAAGLASREESARSLRQLARCAVATGDLSLAARALIRAARYHMVSTSQGTSLELFSAVLAEFELAGVLDKLGDREGARAHYQRFLAHWGNADRPVPEVQLARTALAELGPE